MPDFSGGISNQEQSYTGLLSAFLEFSGGLTNQEQSFSGKVNEFLARGGLTQSIQSFSGLLKIPAIFVGTLTNPEQAFSGSIIVSSLFSGTLANLPQRFNETRQPEQLFLVPRNAFGYTDGSYSYVILANKEALIVTDPWWLGDDCEAGTGWVGGEEEAGSSLPAPPTDGRVYAMINGEWVDITDSLINPPS
jgi:hypothetical protein